MQATEAHASRQQVILGIGFAFAAAIAYASSQVITRQLVSDVPSLVGSSLALFWGTIAFFAISYRSFGEPRPNFRRGAVFFAGVGVFSALGIMGLFQALKLGQVVVVSPVISTNPLFTLLFAAIFLRGIERLTPRIVLGAVLVVSGVIVLSIA